MLDCAATTQAPLTTEIDGAAALWGHQGSARLCCRDSSRMGRRRDRRHATLGGGGRRVKLDLWPDEEVPFKPTESVANDQIGGDESQFDSAGVSSPRQQTGAGLGVENPLSLLGQYSDEDVEADDEAEEEQFSENGTGRLEQLSAAAGHPQDDQVANYMSDVRTGGLLEHEVGAAEAPVETVPSQDNWHTDFQASTPVSMSDKNPGEDDRLLSSAGTSISEQVEIEPATKSFADEESAVAEGWKAVMDAESRKYYFWNTLTGETSWDCPVSLQNRTAELHDELQHGESNVLDEKGHTSEADTEVLNNVLEQDGQRVVTNNGDEVVAGVITEEQSSLIHGAEQVHVGPDISDVPVNAGSLAGLVMEANTDVLEETIRRDDVEASPPLQNGEAHVHPQECREGGNADISTDVASPNGRVDAEQKQKKLLEWGQSVASRLETLAGEALQSLPLLVRFAIEASVRVTDCKILASQGMLEEPLMKYSESHFRRLEAALSADVEQKAVVDRILERSFSSLHAAIADDESRASGKTSFRALRPPQRAVSGGELEDSTPEQLPVLADSGGSIVPLDPTDIQHEDDNKKARDPEEPIKPPGAESPCRGHILQAEQHTEEPGPGLDEAHSNLLDPSRDVDMDMDMEVDDGSCDNAVYPSLPTSNSYSLVPAVDYLLAMQAGYLPPGLLPAYSVPMPAYPESLTSSMWQPPPLPPLPVYNWVPPPPPESDIAPPPPPDEPPPPIDYPSDVAVPELIPSYPDDTSFSYSAPSMYYYPPAVEAYGMVNGTVNGSWTGMLAVERSDLRADQAHDSTLKSQPDETVLKSSSPVTEAVSMSDNLGASAGPKKSSKATRVKKRSHASSVATTLRSNKKVSNLVNKWIAAKEELQETDEEDEDNALYDIQALEKKRQREIEEWRRQQLASGGALENANFQPLGILDWRERVKRAKKVETSEEERIPTAAEASPSADARQERQKPDLKEINKGLPSGWQAFWDSTSAEVYYGNVSTQETSWERPQ